MLTVRPAGFTLVELLIGLAIAALLVMLAMPGYSVWIADAHIRNGAESIASGARFAQGQALARNTRVDFILDPTTATGGWRVVENSDGSVLQADAFAEGANLAAFTVAPAGETTVSFDGLGRITKVDGSGNLVPWSGMQVVVTSANAVTGARNLIVLVGGGDSTFAGQLKQSRSGIKICDPKWPPTDAKGCPT
jgi:type IV fimbrial biogenesis protein FimT